MNIETYQTLTGLTVTNEAMAEAMIKKTRLQLETLLGYPLLKNRVLDNHYEELGKVQNECNCDIDDLHVHFYCTNCHRTYCLRNIHIPTVSLPQHFTAESINYVIKGLCDHCSH